MKHKSKIILLIISIIAIVLRFFYLGSLPYSLNGDEKAFGYYAWSIANFGTDEYGNKLPLYFPSIGDYKYPVYTYLSAPFSYVLGLNENLPRLVSSLASILMIFVIYSFSKILFKSEKIALISAGLLAISPWNITFSRTASESNLMTLLSFSGFYFLYKYLFSYPKIKNLVFSLTLLILSLFTYSAGRIFIPLMILFFVVFSIIKKNKIAIKKSLIIFISICLIVGISFINPASRARANSISVLSRSETRQEWLAQSAYVLGLGQPTNPLITRTFFNKPIALFNELVQRYLSHFSPNYLFVSGDIVKLNAIHNFGNFYIFEIIFFIIGIGLLINRIFKKDFPSFLIIAGIIISPIAASTTIETPSAVRQLVGLPYFLIAISLGINLLVKKIKWIIVLIVMLYLYFFIFLILSIFKIKPYQQPWTTDQGNQELVNKIWQVKDNYKYVFIPNDPYIDFLFYKKISPKDFLSEAKIKTEKIGEWNRVIQYKNIIFNVDKNCTKTGQVNALYICTGEEVSPYANIIDVIRYNDGNPKYIIYDFIPNFKPTTNPPSKIKYMKEDELDWRWPNSIYTIPNQYYIDLFL